ncbi:3-oxoadipate enol-lactonase 2 [compost metagenome]
MVVCGAADPVTTAENGRFMQERIRGAELVEFHAAHLSNVEAGESFSRRVLEFLRG